MIGNLLIKNCLAFSSSKYTLTVVRHGESIWNKEKKWAGWTDIPLSSFGIKEIKECAKALKGKGIHYDVVYTSMLSRAIKSTNYILDELNIHHVPVHKDWRLNQKHYGSLQGCSKVQVNEKHGDKIVNQWRRSMNVPPPPLDKTHQSHPTNNKIYAHIDPALLPNSESLGDIIKRFKPLWDQQISKDIESGKNVLIVAHGSSIRALIYTIKPNLTDDEIKNFNIPNATPIIIQLDEKLHATKLDYLADEHQIAVKMNKIKYETKRTQVQ